MIVDTSALIAILRNEPEAKDCAQAIERNQIRRVSAANFVETALVIDGSRDPIASRRFDDLLNEAQIAIEPVTEAQARVAREAYAILVKAAGIPPNLIPVTALLTRSQKQPVSLFCSRAMTSSIRI
jgi:ribonuclease VapC